MSKFSIDFSSLENKILKKAYKLSEVKDRLETVGFDLVRFKDTDKSTELWQVQSADDGDYIVSLYEESEEDVTKKSDWDVILSKTAGDLNISYKGDPIVRLSVTKLGFKPQDAEKVPSYLPERLAENKKLVKLLLNELSESAKNQVLNKYPELG